ncbi:hypothetical protein LIER_26575 [Lithospermum erythrorhizon]|uniref:Uncharacterized protein n=1 Tax=Lithospermum erythrorhizon TaxID=34254 RepID=A0AAV3RAE0_LITER
MHGYSKISKIHSSRSKSIDFSDLIIPPQPQKTNENISPNHVHETEESKQSNNNLESKNSNNGSSHFSSEMEYEENDQKNSDMNINSFKLSRNFSVSSSTGSQRFMRLDRQSSKKAIQSAVKKAFSVSRSSSVSEKYTRMNNEQFDSSPLNEVLEGNNLTDNNDEIMQSRSMKKEKTSGGKRILKACKRLFGL